MGSSDFFDTACAKTAKEAFNQLVEGARYDYGHAGYTGTIAEKSNFIEIPLPPDTDPEKYAEKLLDENDDRVDDKWGPAGCIEMKPDETEKKKYGEKIKKFLFFGWASS